MTRKKAQTTITLQFNPPPDGTYPPRILSPQISRWLSSDEPTNLTKHLSVSFDGKRYVLHNDNPKKGILVNGQPMLDTRILKDGDYIRAGSWKGIFQADPVASYRKLFYADLDKIPEDDTHVIEPTEKILNWLVITDKEVSFDGGKNVAKWDEIVRVEFMINQPIIGKRVDITLVVKKGSKDKKLASKFTSLTPQEFITLTSWIYYRAPFALSTTDMNRGIYPDVYVYEIYDKVYVPSRDNADLLPEKYEKMVDFRTPLSKKKLALAVLVVLLIMTVAFVRQADVESSSIAVLVVTYLYAFVSSCVILLMMMIIAFIFLLIFSPAFIIPMLFQRWRYNRQRKKTEATSLKA